MLPPISTTARRRPPVQGNTGQSSKCAAGCGPAQPNEGPTQPHESSRGSVQGSTMATPAQEGSDAHGRSREGPCPRSGQLTPLSPGVQVAKPGMTLGHGLLSAVQLLHPRPSRRNRSTYRTGCHPRSATAGPDSRFPTSSSSSRHPRQAQAWGSRTKLERPRRAGPARRTSAWNQHTEPAHGRSARNQRTGAARPVRHESPVTAARSSSRRQQTRSLDAKIAYTEGGPVSRETGPPGKHANDGL